MLLLLKNQSASIISTYAADVSGVCSALFEFGGMCVMHDASGCNSTYNTHDEPRWYDTDSLVFISGLSEIEAIMGDDEKIIGDIIDTASGLSPEFVAIAGSPIPSMTETDLGAIAAEVQAATGIPSFGVPSTGMNSYIFGASRAFARLTEIFAEKTERTKNPSVNILGTTPLDFSVNGYAEDISRLLEENGFEVIARLGMGGRLCDVKRMGGAQVNLVVSASGLEAARFLHGRFGTPYVIGTPVGDTFSARLIDALRRAAESGGSDIAYEHRVGADTVIIADAVTGNSVAEYAFGKFGVPISVVCPPETDARCGYAHIFDGENGLREFLADAKHVIADPMFKPICPDGAKFTEFPHEAFSGRIYRENIPNLLKIK